MEMLHLHAKSWHKQPHLLNIHNILEKPQQAAFQHPQRSSTDYYSELTLPVDKALSPCYWATGASLTKVAHCWPLPRNGVGSITPKEVRFRKIIGNISVSYPSLEYALDFPALLLFTHHPFKKLCCHLIKCDPPGALLQCHACELLYLSSCFSQRPATFSREMRRTLEPYHMLRLKLRAQS